MSDSFEEATQNGVSWEIVKGEGEGDRGTQEQAPRGEIPHASYAAVGLQIFQDGGGQTSVLDMQAIIFAIKEQREKAILRSKDGELVLDGKTLVMALGPTGMRWQSAPNRSF
jgi:hypothetical protein